MKRNLVIAIMLISTALSSVLHGQNQKLAQTGMKFLSVSTDARSAALGDAVTSVSGHSASLFYNPAAMAFSEKYLDVSIGRTNWIADINYMNGSASYSPAGGKYGVFGVTFVSVDYGELLGTIVWPNDQGYLDVGTFKPTAMAFGVGYAKALSEKFSVGGNIRYVRQSLGTSVVDAAGGADQLDSKVTQDNSANAFSFDFGILYQTGFKSLTFGMCVRNFSTEIKYHQEGFQLPLTFKIGLSMNLFDLMDFDRKVHSLLLSVDAVHPRDYPEQLYIGIEYEFLEAISARIGYSTPNDEHDLSFGLGMRAQNWIALDYAYTPFGIFNDVHRFSFNFFFN